jgi:signal transduction histidine kinase/streptogramin lyase
VVNSIAEDPKGNIWFSTDSKIFRWQPGKIEPISDPIIPPSKKYGSIMFDKNGVFWNSAANGLIRLKDNKSQILQDISWKDTQSGNSLFEDSKGNLWYGCYECGVIVSDGQKIIARYTKDDGLAANIVHKIVETKDGSMWFGTISGLSRLKDGKFTNYSTANGLSNDYVRDIYEDQDGTIWIGTYGGGLNRFNDGKITHITTNNGLFDDIVSRILVDDADNFWMLGNRGIYSVSRKMLNDFADGKLQQIFCNSYTIADGLITSEGNGGYQDAGIKAKDGKLWFAMINGAAIIDPKQESLPAPKPLIEEVLLGRNLVDTSKKVEINPDESLEINYTGINFRKPEQIRFRYKLAGFDANWTEAGTRRLANFPYLPSGEFSFQLQAANADGNWSEEIASFEIIVHPRFYQTWWFYLLVFLVLAAIFYSLYRYRYWLFAIEKAKMEEFTGRLINAQEGERRRIASEIHDQLGQQLLVIKNWSSYCLQKNRKITEMQTPIRQINESAESALNEVRAMAKNLSPYHLDKAGVSNTIRYMVKQVTEFSDIEIVAEIDDIDGILSKENELNFYRIVQEASNNIIKHSKATEAVFSIKRTEKSIRLTVSDNGVGFYQTNLDYERIGIGLHGMAERAKMINGTFSLESNENKGVKIIVEIEI